MDTQEQIIIPYSTRLTAVACVIYGLAMVLFIVSLATKNALLAIFALALLPCATYILIQNKKITVSGDSVHIRHFFGIIKEQKITPAECGFFIAEFDSSRKPTYIDKRIIRRSISPDESKYIYISEYILSKQEQSGSQYVYNEPIIILKYSSELYLSLSKVFTFNCEPFKET